MAVSKSMRINNLHKRVLFLLFLGGIFLFLIFSVTAQAQFRPPFFSPFWPSVPSVFSVPFSTFTTAYPFWSSPFANPFFSPFSPTGFPVFPGTTNPTASVLGSLIPLPPFPIATLAGTTVTAPTTITEIDIRIWLDGPPLSLTLPVPTTIYIVPQATASGFFIPPPRIPFI